MAKTKVKKRKAVSRSGSKTASSKEYDYALIASHLALNKVTGFTVPSVGSSYSVANELDEVTKKQDYRPVGFKGGTSLAKKRELLDKVRQCLNHHDRYFVHQNVGDSYKLAELLTQLLARA